MRLFAVFRVFSCPFFGIFCYIFVGPNAKKQSPMNPKQLRTPGISGRPNAQEAPVIRGHAGVILDYLIRTRGRLSQLTMSRRWGFSRLSDIIYYLAPKLEAAGSYVIRRERVYERDAAGKVRAWWTEYWIEEKEV